MDLDERHDEKEFEPTYFQGLEWEPHIVEQLVEFTGLDPEDLESGKFDDDWKLYDEDERLEALIKYCMNTCHCFAPWFLASFTGLNEDFFKTLQKSTASEEDLNEAVLCLIKGLGPNKDPQKTTDWSEDKNLEAFALEAAKSDGYGHFLGRYDGQEQEITNTKGQVVYYLYRIN